MKKIILSCILLVGGIFFITSSAFADTIQMVGRISNPDTAPAGSKVIFTNTLSQNDTWETTVNPDGTYFLTLPEGTYNISIVPPAQSGLMAVNEYNQKISAQDSNYDVSIPSKPNYDFAKQRRGGAMNIYMYIAIALCLMVLGIIGYWVWRKNKSLLNPLSLYKLVKRDNEENRIV